MLLVDRRGRARCWIPNWGSAASRLLAPWEFVPSVGSVEIVSVTPGNTDVLVGESVEIAAEIKNPAGKPHRASCGSLPRASRSRNWRWPPTRSTLRYRLRCRRCSKPLKYRLEIGDSQTQAYTVGVREKPVVETVEVTFHYPAYLGRKDETLQPEELGPRGAAIHAWPNCGCGLGARGQGLSGVGRRAIRRAAWRRTASCWWRACRC